jgi:hypothetical protein
MAYANKYKITFATKTTKTGYLYLQEDGYSGAVIEYPALGIQMSYIPNSDDPYEPIFASQLNVAIDITDDLANMPNFRTADDRKYFVKLYLGSDLEWCGFTISDDVQVSYSTGRKQLSFNCIDAIGMMRDITLPIPSSTKINDYNTVLYYIRLCLNGLNLPITPNIVTACSFYASGMVDRSTGAANEPFNQSYLPYRTFLSSAYTYNNCLDIISNLVKSFGCRLFMASGKWWIVSINEFANENVYYTEYLSDGTVTASGQFNKLSQIQGYTGNTSNVYFIDNSQVKILRKGFNRVTCNHEVGEVANYFSNGNLRPNSGTGGGNPTNWNTSSTGSGSSVSVIDNANESTAQFRMNLGTTTGANAIIYSFGMPKVNGGEVLKFKWTFFGQGYNLPRGEVVIKITNGSTIYYWGGDERGWTTDENVGFWNVPKYQSTGSGLTDGGVNDYSFSTAACPIYGDVSFQYSLKAGTVSFVNIGNFTLNITPLTAAVNYNSFTSVDKQYSISADIPYGFFAYGSAPIEKGAIVKSTGEAYYNWYQYGKPSLVFASLTGLLMQQYINVYGKNIINVDANIASFETANGYINAAKNLKSTDTDPAQINIADNTYMLGNATIDYPNDSTQVTLLQISNTTITATNNYEISYNNNYNL